MGHTNGTSIWLGATAFDTQPVHRRATRRYDGHFEEPSDIGSAGNSQAIALPMKARNLHLPYEILEYIVQQVLPKFPPGIVLAHADTYTRLQISQHSSR